MLLVLKWVKFYDIQTYKVLFLYGHVFSPSPFMVLYGESRRGLKWKESLKTDCARLSRKWAVIFYFLHTCVFQRLATYSKKNSKLYFLEYIAISYSFSVF